MFGLKLLMQIRKNRGLKSKKNFKVAYVVNVNRVFLLILLKILAKYTEETKVQNLSTYFQKNVHIEYFSQINRR